MGVLVRKALLIWCYRFGTKAAQSGKHGFQGLSWIKVARINEWVKDIQPRFMNDSARSLAFEDIHLWILRLLKFLSILLWNPPILWYHYWGQTSLLLEQLDLRYTWTLWSVRSEFNEKSSPEGYITWLFQVGMAFQQHHRFIDIWVGKVSFLYFKWVNHLVLIVMPSKDIWDVELLLRLYTVIFKICSWPEVCSFD